MLKIESKSNTVLIAPTDFRIVLLVRTIIWALGGKATPGGGGRDVNCSVRDPNAAALASTSVFVPTKFTTLPTHFRQRRAVMEERCDTTLGITISSTFGGGKLFPTLCRQRKQQETEEQGVSKSLKMYTTYMLYLLLSLER